MHALPALTHGMLAREPSRTPVLQSGCQRVVPTVVCLEHGAAHDVLYMCQCAPVISLLTIGTQRPAT